jgi:hypothetical protein
MDTAYALGGTAQAMKPGGGLLSSRLVMQGFVGQVVGWIVADAEMLAEEGFDAARSLDILDT